MPKGDELHATDLATFFYFFGLFPHKSSKPLIGILSAMLIIQFFGEAFSHFDQLQLLGLRLCSSAHALPLFCTDVRNPRSKESDGPTPSQHMHTTYIPIFHYSHLLTVRLSSSVVAEAVASRQNAITAASGRRKCCRCYCSAGNETRVGARFRSRRQSSTTRILHLPTGSYPPITPAGPRDVRTTETERRTDEKQQRRRWRPSGRTSEQD